MWSWRISLYAAILWSGCWCGGECCKTRVNECAQMMEDAFKMATPDQKCSGMTAYVACVQADIADCTDNKVSDLYALNMQAMHCSKAYICSVKLQTCYSKFNGTVRRNIEQSDTSTRMGICRTLLRDIMACQEEVTSQCKGQTGLMETVSSYQTSLNMVCNNTDPCVSLVLKCQQTSGEEDQVSGAAAGNSQQRDQSPLSDCEAQKPVDYCGSYRQAASCIRQGVAACAEHVDVNNTLANLDNSIRDLCSPVSTCGQNVSSCLCHINKQTQSPLSILTSICQTYPPFEACLDSLGPECRSHEEVSKEVSGLKDTYRQYYTLYCTSQKGLCPQAVQCLVDLPHDTLSSLSSPSLSADPGAISTILHLNALCSGGNHFFTCMETASTVCEKQANAVSFANIEEIFLDLCTEPHTPTLQDCPSFSHCLREFWDIELGTLRSQDVHNYVSVMFASATKTTFWCKYLTHAVECIRNTGGAEACALDDELIAVSIQRNTDLQILCEGTATPAPNKPTTTFRNPDFRTKRPKTSGKNSKPGITPRPSQSKNHGTSALQYGAHRTLLVCLGLAFIHSLTTLH